MGDYSQIFIDSLQELINDLDSERLNKAKINSQRGLFKQVYEEYERRALNILKRLKNNNSNKKQIINDLMAQLAMIYSLRYPENVGPSNNNLNNLMKVRNSRKTRKRKLGKTN